MHYFTPEAKPLTLSQKIDWLRLIRSSNVGPTTFRQLINRFGSARAALEMLPELTLRGGARTTPRICSREEAELEIEKLQKSGARLIDSGDPDYPCLLQFIHSPPPLLAVRGRMEQNNDKTIAMIGARNASASGRKLAFSMARELGERGYVTVSGLARGIDFSAHKGAMKTGTIAVFAGGIDQVYPRENMALAEEIIENGGMHISEMPHGSQPRARDFPRRNRLVSGISRGVLVIEAALRSGSLITARYGLEQNREIFAVPGSPADPRSAGTNRLIREGATLVTEAADILEELNENNMVRDLFCLGEDQDDGIHGRQERTGNGQVNEGTDEKLYDQVGPADYKNIIEALGPSPTSVDDLIAATCLPAPMVQSVLLELDLAGRIERSAGQLVALKQAGSDLI